MKKQRLLRIAFVAALFAVAFFLPAEASAETIQQTLRENESIKELHRGLLNIVNIPIILLIVVIAFSEMLRLKIDTYGFKKVLPTLVLAIIAAQFSYLFCKLVIDAANMTITLFTDPNLLSRTFGEASTIPAKYSRMFTGPAGLFPNHPNWQDFKYAMFFDILLKIIFFLVGSVLLLVLCFLFLVRTWMIYFLVIISPVALMALALPQTKTYFNKWWSEFAKWTFMPIPSIFFLWLGVTVLDNPIVTGSWLETSIISVIIAVICLYAAIRVPFKLGGGIMDKFWQYSGAKWGLGKAKDKWVDPWVKQRKDNLMEWYIAQGSQGAKYGKWNPVGMIARRSERKLYEREEDARAVEGKKNTLRREALGGKEYLGKDGKMHPLFLSRKRQLEYAKRADQINADFGEAEWITKHLQNLYKNTEEGWAVGGHQAARRSYAYELRMATDENDEKQARARAVSEVWNYRKGQKNAYHDDTEFGIIKGDHYFHNMAELFEQSKIGLEEQERVAKKFEEDAYSEDAVNGWKVGMLLHFVRSVEKKLADPNLPPEMKDKLENALESYKKEWEKMMVGIQKTYVDGTTKQMVGNVYRLRQMLSNPDGTFNKDLSHAKEIYKLIGLREEERGMSYSRIRKLLSARMALEKSSEAGKRTPEGSLADGEKNFPDQLESLWAGNTIATLGKSAWDPYGRLANAETLGQAYQSPQFALFQSKRIPVMAGVVKTEWLGGNRARRELSEEIDAALDLRANSIFLTEQKKIFDERVKKRNAERSKSGQAELSDDELVKLDEEIRNDPASQQKTAEKVELALAQAIGVDSGELYTYAPYTISETGQIKFDALSTATEQNFPEHGAFMEDLALKIAQKSYRGPDGDLPRGFALAFAKHRLGNQEYGKVNQAQILDLGGLTEDDLKGSL